MPFPSSRARKKTAPVLPDGKPKKGRRLHIRADLAHGGALTVRHMTDCRIHLEGVAVRLADGEAGAGPVWIQLAKPGDFAGHSAGPFSLNTKVFDEIIANFRSTANRAIPIDFEHASEAPATAGSIPVEGAPAQGWIRDLRIENGNLFGLVEWGPKAREYIRSGAYKFISPAIVFNARDRVTGKQIGARLTSAGMTNSPFLDGMRPLAAKDTLAHAPSEYMPALKAAMRLPDLATAHECLDQLVRLREHLDAVDGDATSVRGGVRLTDYLHPLRDAVGAKPGATWEDVLDLVEDLFDAANDVPTDDEHDTEDTPTEPEPIEPGDGETNMADEKSAVALSEANTKVAELSLQLKDVTSTKTALEAEVKTLRDEKSARDDKDLQDRVNEAFDTYKDKKALSDTDKEAMLIVLRSNASTFDKLYPRINPGERHLMRSLTEKREPPARTSDDRTGPRSGESFLQTTHRLMSEKKISYTDAQNEAYKLHRAG